MNNIGRIVTVNRNNWNILYQDKNLWVASFEKVNDDIYFTINPPKPGKKYVYKYNIATNTCVSLELRSNYMTIKDNVMYYFNIETNTINLYNLITRKDKTLISNVDVNNMIIAGNYLYYSTKKSNNIGFYKFNLSTNENVKISDKCADGMLNVNSKIYFIQTAILYKNDYPSQSNGNGKLYCYDGNNIVEL